MSADRTPTPLDHVLALETARYRSRNSNLARCYLDLVDEVARLRYGAEGDQVLDLRPEVLRRFAADLSGDVADLEFGLRKRRPET
jgi:hypothetical protein